MRATRAWWLIFNAISDISDMPQEEAELLSNLIWNKLQKQKCLNTKAATLFDSEQVDIGAFR